MAHLNRLVELGDEISKSARLLTSYLSSNGLDAASFHVDGLAEYPIPSEATEALSHRQNLISMTKELHDLALGPKEGLRYLAWDVSKSTPIRFCYSSRAH